MASASPDQGPGSYLQRGLAVISKNDIWAVGGTSDEATLAEHWDGSKWSIP
jgi:hypothetical protein